MNLNGAAEVEEVVGVQARALVVAIAKVDGALEEEDIRIINGVG